jgi:hypothetical protein
MAKKKAAKTVSWRTLTRRAEVAEKKGHKAAGKRLRAMAATARSGERKKTKKTGLSSTRRENEIRSFGLTAIIANSTAQQQAGINRNSEGITWKNLTGANPGRGEIVGGAVAKLAEDIVKLARRKGGTDAVQDKIMKLQATAKYEGQVEIDKAATQRLIEVQQTMADRIVCGFLTEVAHAQKLHNGLPPRMTWVLNSYTIVKIVDALHKGGYTESGKNVGPERGYDKESL